MSARTAHPVPLELAGQRVKLRTLTEQDYDSWFEVRSRCRQWLVPWEPRAEGFADAGRGPPQLRYPLRHP